MERPPLGHIALDAMGGDGAPLVSIEGALDGGSFESTRLGSVPSLDA